MKSFVCGVCFVALLSGCVWDENGRAVSADLPRMPNASDFQPIRCLASDAQVMMRDIKELLPVVDGKVYEKDLAELVSRADAMERHLDRLHLDLAKLQVGLDADHWARLRAKDEQIMARLDEIVVEEMKFEPPQTIMDAMDFLSNVLAHPPQGERVDVKFDLCEITRATGVVDDCETEVEKSAPVELPKIAAKRIGFKDALSLVTESVGFTWELSEGCIEVGKRIPAEGSFYFSFFPAPLKNADRDWVKWLRDHGVVLPEGSTVLYDRPGGVLRLHTAGKGFEMFVKALPLIYSGNDE